MKNRRRPAASQRSLGTGARLPRYLALGLAWAALLGANPIAAQSMEFLVTRELDFARAVSDRFRYVDMAEATIAKLAEMTLTGSLREELDLVKCDVYAAGARGEGVRERRLELYDKALDAYQDYIDEYPFSDLVSRAERRFIELVDAYGQSVELALAEAVGEPAQDMRERASRVLEDATTRTDKLIGEIDPEDATQSQLNERWRLMLYKGRILLSLAKISEEGIFFFSKCEKVLEELAFEAGEQSLWGMNAYLVMSEAKLVQSEFSLASDFAVYVVDNALPRDADARRSAGWDEMPPDVKQRRWTLVENGMPKAIDAFLNQGLANEAIDWALHFHNSWKRNGFKISAHGYLALLACSRALMDAGGYVGGTVSAADLAWFESEDQMKSAGFRSRRNSRRAIDLALQIAQTVNQANRGNILEVRAQRLISDVIDRQDVTPDPEILFEAAQGDYNARNYGAALGAFKRVMISLDAQDEATRKQYGAAVLYFIGSSLSRMDRDLESALAHREGATIWQGDPQYDPKNAKSYYDAISAVRRGALGDTVIDGLWREAEDLRIQLGEGNQDDIKFRQADRAYDQGDYGSARTQYKSIEPAAKVYEEALAKAALCLYKLNDLGAAREEFRSYVEDYVPDPKNRLTVKAKQSARRKASAQATFYLGRIAYGHNDYPAVERWLGRFHERFPAQTNYAPTALYMVILSNLADKDFEGAKEVFGQLHENFATHSRTGAAAARVYKVLDQERGAAEQAGDAERVQQLKGQMAEYMHISNELAGEPAFSNLRTESNLWMELARWEEAEACLRKTVGLYDSDASHANDIERFVRRDLGLVLLEQKKVPEAFDVLDQLVPKPDDDDDTRRPAAEVLSAWCRSVSGWIEGDARNIVEVPGVGGAENLAAADKCMLKLIGREKPHWACPWYELKFALAYIDFQWSLIDSAKLTGTQRVLKDLTEFLSEDLSEIAEACGDDVLQKRFHWLARKAR